MNNVVDLPSPLTGCMATGHDLAVSTVMDMEERGLSVDEAATMAAQALLNDLNDATEREKLAELSSFIALLLEFNKPNR